MHPEHLLLMRQLVAAVQDMGCTLKSLNTTVGHLVKEKQGRDIGTNTEDKDREMIKPISADGTPISITENILNYCSQQPSEASMTCSPAVDDQNSLASSVFYVGNTESSTDKSPAPVVESQSGSYILGRIEEVSVVKEEVFTDEEAETNYGVQLTTEYQEECDMKEKNENLTLLLKEEEESESSDAADTVDNLLSGALEHTVEFDTAYDAECANEKVGANSICEATSEHSASGGRLEGQREEPLAKRKHKCQVCSRMFRAPSHVKQHMRTHSGEKPFRCSVCRKTFSVESYLKRHLLVHSGGKPFKCTVCGMSLKEKKCLERHMLRHSQKWPFTCKQCGKGAYSSFALNEHMRSHSGEKPFCCVQCGVLFSRKSSLNTHLRAHSNVLPFACDHCHATFKDEVTLETHMRIHLGN